MVQRGILILFQPKKIVDADITIIGAGVIGLAIGENLSANYKNVFLMRNILLSDRRQAAETAKLSTPVSIIRKIV